MTPEQERLRRLAEDAPSSPEAAVDALRRYVQESAGDGGGEIILPLRMAQLVLEAL